MFHPAIFSDVSETHGYYSLIPCIHLDFDMGDIPFLQLCGLALIPFWVRVLSRELNK